MKGKAIDWSNKKLFHLTFIRRSKKKYANDSHVLWEAKCDCGNEVIVYPRNVVIGKKQSCGCVISHCLYGSWVDMRSRCNSKTHRRYKNYGAIGIKICAEWNFWKNFERWALSNDWKPGFEIHRVDNSNDYCPENCIWLSPSEHAKIKSKDNKQELKAA